MTANVDQLRASINRCLHELRSAQSSVNVTRDRADGASRILANTAEGSANDLLAEAIGICATMDVKLEGVLAGYAQALDCVERYRDSKCK